jgi:hypothetical protein
VTCAPGCQGLVEAGVVKGENRAADPGRSRPTAKRNAPAETLGYDGGPLTPKSAPGAAEGRAGKEKPTQNLFPSKMVKTGGERGRRRRSTGQGRDDRHAGRGNTTRDTTGSGSHGRGTGGQRSDIGSLVGPGTYSKQKRKRAMYKREQAGTQKNVRAGADKGWSPDISDRAGSTVTSRCV